VSGIIELELYSYVFCVRKFSPDLLGKRFTVTTDHKDLVYLANLSITKLVRWRVLLSEFKFLVEHIPGVQNIVVDGLTREMSLSSMEILKLKRHMFRGGSYSSPLRNTVISIPRRWGVDIERRHPRRHRI